MNTFSIERGDQVIHGIVFVEDVEYSDLINARGEEAKNHSYLNEFIMDVCYMALDKFEESEEDIVCTLVDEDEYFIWSILINIDDPEHVKYKFIDWEKENKKYCYKTLDNE